MVNLFFSYSHIDESYREELEKHLIMLRREGLINCWNDRKLIAGDDIKDSINLELNRAEIIILLVSPDFLASGYCYDVEFKLALERYSKGEARLIAVIVRPCDWLASPLKDLLATPIDGLAISEWENRDSAYLDVTKQIRSALRVGLTVTARPKLEVKIGEKKDEAKTSNSVVSSIKSPVPGNAKFTILHISDMHYSDANMKQHKKISEGLIADLETLKNNQGLKPDIVVFSGDLVSKGSDGENAFRSVSSILVEPLLNSIGLSQDKFFCVPGNHDVDRDKIYPEIEKGLPSELTDSVSLGKYYTECLEDPKRLSFIERKLAEFLKFQKSYSSQYQVDSNFFYSTSIVPIGNLSVGIATFNSAWRCSGYGTDKGRLILGMPIVDEAYDQLKKCDVKIAVCHHPQEWLEEWDQRDVRNRLARDYDILFNGHLHNSDPVSLQQVLGSFYISSAGCLHGGSEQSFYSLVTVDIGEAKITAHLRKWYPNRGVFDQETDKAENGIVSYGGLTLNDPRIHRRIWLAEVRARLRDLLASDKFVNPLEGIVDLGIDDLFVEPFICDHSVYKRDEVGQTPISLDSILKKECSVIVHGGKESGKSTLLLHINERELVPKYQESSVKVPVRIPFQKFSRHNTDSTVKSISRRIDDLIEMSDLVSMLEEGNIILLVDDLGTRDDLHRDRRLEVFCKFIEKYPKVKVVATVMESVRPFDCPLLLKLRTLLEAKEFYLWPFTISKIRNLIENIARSGSRISGVSLDVERMVDQIAFYFKNLQIPVTPLAVTLFIGVLYRDTKQKDIQNEAFLIENYLEDLLEKTDGAKASSDLDFQEKVSFLAHIAFAMHRRNTAVFTAAEFDEERDAFYARWGEDVPPAKVFDELFRKGILFAKLNKISFKFKFWSNFFLAKAMCRDVSNFNAVVERVDYLKFASALGYKAGLLRNDVSLLQMIKARLIAAGLEIGANRIEVSAGAIEIGDEIQEFTGRLESEIKSKNSVVLVDKQRQESLNLIEIDSADLDGETDDQFIDLLTLHSDIIRHTREIDEEIKIENIQLNVRAYLGLVTLVNEEFLKMAGSLTADDLAKMLFPNIKDPTAKRRIESLLQQGKRMLGRVVPSSVALHMCDHLGTARLCRSFLTASNRDGAAGLEKAYYLILAYRADPERALEDFKKFISEESGVFEDFVTQGVIMILSQESVMTSEKIEKVVDLLELIGKKYTKRINVKTDKFIVATDIRSDIKKRLQIGRSRGQGAN